jgi:hypothetical protein
LKARIRKYEQSQQSGQFSKSTLNSCADEADATDEHRLNQGLTVKIRRIRPIRAAISSKS